MTNSGATRSAVSFAFRQLAQELIWTYCNRHEPGGKPNIALFGSRRSGTTLLAEVIAANRGIKSVDQPLTLNRASPYQLRRMPIFAGVMPFALDEGSMKRLRAYFADILEGRLHVNEPWRLWRSGFSFRTDRIVLKLTNAHFISEWLNKQFDLDTVVLLRHPISQSLSLLRNSWGLKMRGFLGNETYCETFLQDKQLAAARDIYKSGSDLHKYVLDWCLENLPLIRAYSRHQDWYFVSYEDFVLNASQVIDEWAGAFGLPDVEAMNRAAGRASLSTRRASESETKAAIVRSDQEALLTRWRDKVDEETERSVMRILEVMEIDFYRAGSHLATIGRRPGAAVDRSSGAMSAGPAASSKSGAQFAETS